MRGVQQPECCRDLTDLDANRVQIFASSKGIHTIDIRLLREIVTSFHDTLSQIAHQFQSLFGAYPRGACGHGFEMLGYHLLTVHAVETTYCNGVTHNTHFQSYAWLEYGNVIIDITCSQFDNCPFPCPYIDIDHSWHQPWKPKRRPIQTAIGGICYWEPAYKKLLSVLPAYKRMPPSSL